MKKPSHSLSGKFTAGIVIILIFMLGGTLLINSRLVQKYYLYQQRAYVRKIGDALCEELKTSTPEQAIQTIENQENVLIVSSPETLAPDILSNDLREAFRQKGLGFQKFWLWEQDYTTVVEKGSQFRLYGQDKLNYSILVQYLSIDSEIYAIAAIVPNAKGFIAIINRFGFLLYTISILFSIILITILIRHITTPLKKIRAFTYELAAHRYTPLSIHTNDELEDVAESLNRMGKEILDYQTMLTSKNEQMKQLLSDVAHDLKTPISLIGMYSGGIKDGLDDGTFLDTIIQQNQKISQLVEKLLHLSRIERNEQPVSSIDASNLLQCCIKEQLPFFSHRNLTLQLHINPVNRISANPELLSELFSNLLSNAAKYSSGTTVSLSLSSTEEGILFLISNEFDNPTLDISQIWEPFYVGEVSRNKQLSGTGLGLSIVKKITEKAGCSIECTLQEHTICFKVLFPNTLYINEQHQTFRDSKTGAFW